MARVKGINDSYMRKKGLELVMLDLLGELEKSFSKVNDAKYQPIKRCWCQAVYDGKLKQVETFLEVCDESDYISGYQFRKLAKKYKEITGVSFKKKQKQKLRGVI